MQQKINASLKEVQQEETDKTEKELETESQLIEEAPKRVLETESQQKKEAIRKKYAVIDDSCKEFSPLKYIQSTQEKGSTDGNENEQEVPQEETEKEPLEIATSSEHSANVTFTMFTN